MKLELKHLAPYLPYGLKIRIGTDSEAYDLEMSVEDEMESDYISLRDVIGNEHKPILRPLLDLTKEIDFEDGKLTFSDIYFSSDKIKKLQDFTLCQFGNPLNDIDYSSVQTLLKYHFDVFGLIDANLAIDINTLNNQNI